MTYSSDSRSQLRGALARLAKVEAGMAEAEANEVFGRFSRRYRQLTVAKTQLHEEIVGTINDLFMEIDEANRAYDRLMASFSDSSFGDYGLGYDYGMDDDGYLHMTSQTSGSSPLNAVDFDTGLPVSRSKNGLSLLA